MCIILNLLAVEIEIDARVLLGWVTEEYNGNLHHASLIMDCITLINLIPLAKMSYYFCEANKCTNALARRDSSSNQDFIFFNSPPMDLCVLMITRDYNMRGFVHLVMMLPFSLIYEGLVFTK